MNNYQIFEMVHRSLSNGIRSVKAHAPRKWLAERKLSIEISGAVFCSGQMHHRKAQQFLDQLTRIGFLSESPKGTNTGRSAKHYFGTNSVLFPLKDELDRVVNYYAINIKNGNIEYLNSEGIYPAYPREDTTRIYLVENPLDAASLIEAKIISDSETVMSLYDDGKLLKQHIHAIARLKELKEVVVAI